MSKRTLTYDQAQEMRRLGAEGYSTTKLSAMFNCNPTTAARVLRGEIYKTAEQYENIEMPKGRKANRKPRVQFHWEGPK